MTTGKKWTVENSWGPVQYIDHSLRSPKDFKWNTKDYVILKEEDTAMVANSDEIWEKTMSTDEIVHELMMHMGEAIKKDMYVLYFSESSQKDNYLGLFNRDGTSRIKKYIFKTGNISKDGKINLYNLTTETSFDTKVSNVVKINWVADYIEQLVSAETLKALEKDVGVTLAHLQVKKPIEQTYTRSDTNEETKMNKINTSNIVKSNVDAAKVAAKITAGKTLNKVVKDKVVPMLPRYARGYADSVLGEVVIANLAQFVVDNFAANNNNAKLAAEAMMTAAMADFMASFNLEEVITDLVSQVNLEAIKE